MRDGRPIKLEGNPQHPVSRGGLCATGQANILGLYDSQRLQHPLNEGKKSSWAGVDREIQAGLANIRGDRGAVRFLSGTITSPTTRAIVQEFLKGFPDAWHIVYDPLSNSALLDAHEQTHGLRVLPRFHFDKAEVIVSFDADFLGTWISPVEYTADYRAGRDLEAKRVSYHVQFEPRMSVSGSKADGGLRLRRERWVFCSPTWRRGLRVRRQRRSLLASRKLLLLTQHSWMNWRTAFGMRAGEA